jgi:uncharacterized protein
LCDAKSRNTAALAAFEKGDYATAMRQFLTLAGEGFANAQYNVAIMYEAGQGVSKDYSEAAKWYLLAAEQGHPSAQNNLGLMLVKGQGVKRDLVRAHMWFTLSAVKGTESAIGNAKRAASLMTASQIVEAQKLAREWKLHRN